MENKTNCGNKDCINKDCDECFRIANENWYKNNHTPKIETKIFAYNVMAQINLSIDGKYKNFSECYVDSISISEYEMILKSRNNG